MLAWVAVVGLPRAGHVVFDPTIDCDYSSTPLMSSLEQVMLSSTMSLTMTTWACPRWALLSRSCCHWPCYWLRLIEHTLDGLPRVGHTIFDHVINMTTWACPWRAPSSRSHYLRLRRRLQPLGHAIVGLRDVNGEFPLKGQVPVVVPMGENFPCPPFLSY